MTDAPAGREEAGVIPPDKISILTQSVHNMQLQLVLLNERLPAHIEATSQKLEEHDTRLGNHGSRLYDREKEALGIRADITALRVLIDGLRKPKTPWTQVVAGVVGIITGLGTLITILIVFAAVVPALASLR